MQEVWKDIKGYEGIYQVSSLGRVKSLCRKINGSVHHVRKEYMFSLNAIDGYPKASLRKDGQCKIFYVHRLVAEAFIENPHNLPFINHKDEDKTNNCVDNLERCSHSYNINYGTRNQRVAEKFGIPVIQKTLGGEVVKIYPSTQQAERDTGIWRSQIWKCVCGKNKTAGGFTWEIAHGE